MTIAMVWMHRRLPRYERYPLPPSLITQNLEEAADVDPVPPRPHLALTLVNHFGYGAAVGALYGPTAGRFRAPAAVKGVGWGLVVWTFSYLVMLPAVGLLSPATRHPARRNGLMILAHVVWGGVTGWLADRLTGLFRAKRRQPYQNRAKMNRGIVVAGRS